MGIGQRMLRVEDGPLLTGTARFLDDIDVPGALEAVFLRSPVAHGEIRAIDTTGVDGVSGVEAIFCADDLSLPPLVAPISNPLVHVPPQPCLAHGKVRHVGEPVAIVIAGSRYHAEDALELIGLEIDALEPVTTTARSLEADAPALYDGMSNVLLDIGRDEGDVDAAFAEAATVVERTFRTPRQSAMPIEPRGVLAVPEEGGAKVTLYTSTQAPHKTAEVVAQLLGLEPGAVRVITPDVGGGFGVKAHTYPEEVVVTAAALKLGKPVKWVEDRVENLASSAHARPQELHVKAAVDAEGTLLALDVDMVCDQGAYGPFPHGVALEAQTTSGMLPGPYRLPNFRVRARAVGTNKAPVGAYRGVGFVLAIFVHERMMDMLAEAAGIDRVEIRRRNLLKPEEFPYTSITGQPYDNGDYPRALEMAMERIGYTELEERKAQARAEGKLLGLGISSYVEPTGMNSKVFKMRGMDGIAGFDDAHVTLGEDGIATVWTTTPAIGQGTNTTMAQIAAEALGVDAATVRVENSDTGVGNLHGTGSFASRSAVAAGGAVTAAAAELRARLLDDAAERIEAAVADLEIKDGAVRVAGSPGSAVPIGEIVAAAPDDRYRLSMRWDPPQTVYPYATHTCVVLVDPETGHVEITDYVVVEDCGRLINPMVVEGQVHGAVTQGVAGALYEAHDYDEDGQLRTASLMDYLVPTAAEIPAYSLIHLEIPTPMSPLGVKGVGEGGTIGAGPAVANAVADAVSAEFNELPVTPERVRAALRRA